MQCVRAEVPQLQCLDVEDIPTITDDLASTISGTVLVLPGFSFSVLI